MKIKKIFFAEKVNKKREVKAIRTNTNKQTIDF